ncbi:hypothetical protein ACVWY7_004506 [Bacillus sp. TE9106W]
MNTQLQQKIEEAREIYIWRFSVIFNQIIPCNHHSL